MQELDDKIKGSNIHGLAAAVKTQTETITQLREWQQACFNGNNVTKQQMRKKNAHHGENQTEWWGMQRGEDNEEPIALAKE